MTEPAAKPLSPARIRIMVTIFFFVSGFGFNTWASRIPTIQQRLHLNEAELGAVLFALPVGLMATLPLTSVLLSRFDSRRIMMIGAVCYNLMLCAIGFVTQAWQLVIALVCFGSSRNLFNISVNAQSIGVQALYDRSIIARFHAVWSLAGFAGAAVGSLMVSFYIPPAWHFGVVSVLLTTLCVYAFPGSLRQQPAPRERRPWFALPDKSLVKYGLISFASMACEGTMIDWSGIYFHKAVHAHQWVATLGFVAYMVAITLGRFTGDQLANRFGIRRMLSYSGVFIAGGLLLATLLPYVPTAALGFILTGFGVSCVIPMVFSMAGRSVGMSSGSAIASVSTVGYLGFLIVPPLVGSVAQAAGLRGAFGMMIGFGLLITALVQLTLKEERLLGAAEEAEVEEQGREADRYSL
jgi:MFS family permease